MSLILNFALHGHSTTSDRIPICRDYRRIEHLDRFESEGLDEEPEEVLDEEEQFAARAAAEREMDQREGRAGGQLPRALEGEMGAMNTLRLKLKFPSIALHYIEDLEDSQFFRTRRDRRRRGVSPGPSDTEDDMVSETPSI